jgi:hypothetical protein
VLRIDKAEIDGHNGHMTIHARIVVSDGASTVYGASETHGIDPTALKQIYAEGLDNSTPEQEQAAMDKALDVWLQWVHTKMLDNHSRRTAAQGKILSLQGKIISFEEDKTDGGSENTEV